ncbi:flagellar hook assembly protein FlgD [uncultured Desulfuromusa sp.]|uniref:flagellar hook assembly protein FlgD n=1 Tax=uncultured Desulfuromusa sp. TaxID=219183 RepID=UPI002AA83F6E|nr:flagellar hook assembly protein FlgD [uncultured Desulfuromusa sp.]
MSAISGIDTGNSLPATSTSDNASMGKQDFLLLLVAQLENQDPMNPEDATEFTSQLAQFSSLEQLENVNKSLEGLSTMSSEMERMSALGLIGTVVIAQKEEFSYNGEPIDLGYELEAPADDVKLYILNSTGATLATLSPTENSEGQHFFEWDGASDAGMPLEPGDYELVVRAVDEDDAIVPSKSLIRGLVYGVDLDPDGASLETTAGPVKMSKVEKAGVSL